MQKRAFGFMDIPARPAKPREKGMTMMIDWGIGPARQRDMLEVAGEFIDIAKIAVGLSGVLPEAVLRDKIAAYREHDIEAFIGGQFLEYAVARQGMKAAAPFFGEARRLGYSIVEVSDNCLDMPAKDKAELIRMGREDFGLKILGEVGSKNEKTDTAALVAGIKQCLAAGAWKVFVEGAEFTSAQTGELLEDVIKGVTRSVNLQDILFELPGPWISNVHTCGVHDMALFLMAEFGPDVNIANVLPDWIVELETLRTGVGVKLKM